MLPARLLGLCGALLLTGCGGGGSEPNGTLDAASAQQVGSALAARISGAAASFALVDLSSGRDINGGYFAPPGDPAPPVLCPGTGNYLDTDQDGVPDDLTYTFNQADCSTYEGYTSGSIHVTDPSTTAVGYHAQINHFRSHLVGPPGGDFVQVTMNGTHDVLGTSTSATLSEALTTTLDGLNGGQTLHGTVAADWTLRFDDEGAGINMNNMLDNGAFTIHGDMVYDVNGMRFTLSLETITPLEYQVGCRNLVNPFIAGEIRAHPGGSNGSGYIRLTFTHCGQAPTIELVGA